MPYVRAKIGLGIRRTNVIATHRFRIRRLCKTNVHRTFFRPCLCFGLCLFCCIVAGPMLSINKYQLVDKFNFVSSLKFISKKLRCVQVLVNAHTARNKTCSQLIKKCNLFQTLLTLFYVLTSAYVRHKETFKNAINS